MQTAGLASRWFGGMGSGCVHEIDVAHIEERGHHIQLWEYLQQELFLTPDCIAKTIKKLLSPEVAHLADRYGVETEKRARDFCLAITLAPAPRRQ
jgi:hypothetical protein